MKRFKGRRLISRTKVIVFCIALVLFLTFMLVKFYSNYANQKLIGVAKIKLNEYMETFLSTNIGYDILNEELLENIIVINKNSDGEILYVDYDLDKAYLALDTVTQELNTLISSLENGTLDTNNKNIVSGGNKIAIKIPMGSASSNILFANLGPNIYIPVSFVGSILTNIKTNITNYGLNNALLELYVTIKITTNLIGPVDESSQVIEYDVLVASTVINGRVPEVYGGVLSTNSTLYSS